MNYLLPMSHHFAVIDKDHAFSEVRHYVGDSLKDCAGWEVYVPCLIALRDHFTVLLYTAEVAAEAALSALEE